MNGLNAKMIAKARRLTLVRQPEGSRCCGQACIAMIAGVTLQKAIEVVGHPSNTQGPALRKALRHFGIRAGPTTRLSSEHDIPAKLAILTLTCPRKKKTDRRWSHYVVYDGRILNPGGRGTTPWPVTSYIEIT